MHLSVNKSKLLRKSLFLGLIIVCFYSIWFNFSEVESVRSVAGEDEELSGYNEEGLGTNANFLFHISVAMTMLGDPLLPESGANTFNHHVVFSYERDLLFKFISKGCCTNQNFGLNSGVLIKECFYQTIEFVDVRDFVVLDRQFRV